MKSKDYFVRLHYSKYDLGMFEDYSDHASLKEAKKAVKILPKEFADKFYINIVKLDDYGDIVKSYEVK